MREAFRGLLSVDVCRETVGRRVRDFARRECTGGVAARQLLDAKGRGSIQ